MTANRGVSGGGSTGSPSICSIGVTRTTLLPYCPMPSEIAPAFSIVPNESGQYTGEPENPSATPVVSTAGPDTCTRIRGPSPGACTTPITWTLNDEIVVPWITVSPVQFIPGWTCDSGMIGPAAAHAALAGRHSPPSTRKMSRRTRISRPLSGPSLARAAWTAYPGAAG